MSGDAAFSPEHPASRIRAKLEERRVLEARFLLRQFSGEIDAEKRQALEQEVSQLLAEVEHLRHQARTAAAEGKREEAGRLYHSIEQIVTDLPGLAEERAALAGAEAIFSHPAAQEADEWRFAPVDDPVPASDREAAQRDPLASINGAGPAVWEQTAGPAGQEAASRQRQRRHRSFGLWLAAVSCAGLAVLLFLIWQERTKAPPAMPPSPAPVAARNTATGPIIVINPIVSGNPAALPHPLPAPLPFINAGHPQAQPQTPPAPEKPTPPAEESAPASSPQPQTGPAADQTVAPPPALQLGTLQVRETNRQPNQRPKRQPGRHAHRK